MCELVDQLLQVTSATLEEEQADIEAISSLQSELVLTKRQLMKTAERLTKEQGARLKLQTQKRLVEKMVAEQETQSIS